MSSKKRSGIGGFWDTVAPPDNQVAPEAATQSSAPTVEAPDVPETRTDPPPARPAARPTRPRGRPPTGVTKERMTVNLDPRSLQILEQLRYQARMQGRRNATFSDLLDEAVALLAKH